MSQTQLSSADLDERQKRMRYHAWHRGTREMDMLLGRFADFAIQDMTPEELDNFEALIEAQDRDIFAWILGQSDIPDLYNTSVLKCLMKFHVDFPTAKE
jgi:antitoxin CptB